MDLKLTAYQQPRQFIAAVNAAGELKHDAEGVGTIRRVHVTTGRRRGGRQKMAQGLMLCTSRLVVKDLLAKGDGRPIPPDLEVVFADIQAVPKKKLPRQGGFYDVSNVMVSANGQVVIRFTKDTFFTPSPEVIRQVAATD